jgi:hypothetical protein
MIPALESLDTESLRPLFRRLLTTSQIRAILARRDAILEKVEEDRRKYGDGVVFVHGPSESDRDRARATHWPEAVDRR